MIHFHNTMNRFDRPRSPFSGRRTVDDELRKLCDELNLNVKYITGFQQRDHALDAEINIARSRRLNLQRVVDIKEQDLLAAQKSSFLNESTLSEVSASTNALEEAKRCLKDHDESLSLLLKTKVASDETLRKTKSDYTAIWSAISTLARIEFERLWPKPFWDEQQPDFIWRYGTFKCLVNKCQSGVPESTRTLLAFLIGEEFSLIVLRNIRHGSNEKGWTYLHPDQATPVRVPRDLGFQEAFDNILKGRARLASST